MFIQDFYLGLDGKQRVIVLSAAGASGLFLLCCVLWIFSGRPDSYPGFLTKNALQ
jgi:hypothetical protein